MFPNLLLSPVTTFSRAFRIAIFASAASAALFSTAASADCTGDTTGENVTCTGASTGYTNLGSGVSLSADSTAAITGPVLLGNSATVTNGGSITSTSTAPILQVGTGSSITNNGTVSVSAPSGGSAAVVVGDDGTLTNNGNLTAIAGATVVQFGQAGTFINNSAATSAVIGNIQFGPNVDGGTSNLENYNTAFGITGNVYSSGNTSIYNDGLFQGSFTQTPTGGAVSFTNDSGGTFTGSITTGDPTAIVNAGTMSLTAATNIGTARLAASSFTNSGTLNVGVASPVQLVVNGSFVNSPSGILNIALHSNGTSAPVAGTSYSQIYAAGPNGVASLGGTLNLVASPGFYPTGSTYNVILADQSISGNFAAVNGSTLPFIKFVPVGIATIGGQQAYEVMAVRSQTYAQVLASVGTPSEIAIATGLEPLVTTANSNPTGAEATFIGDIDLLTIPQTQTLLDQINPANYVAYAQAMTDQVNLFDRKVMMRMMDGPVDQSRSGGWIDGSGQFHVGSTPANGTSERIWDLTAGYDLGGPHWLVGAALSASSATVSTANGSLDGENHAFIVGAYGAFDAGPFVATGQVDYDLGSLSATKMLSLAYTTTTTAATATSSASTTTTATNTTVTADPGDHLFKASGTLGLNLHIGGMKATPFVGLEYARGAINGFTESGGSAADLTVAQINVDRTNVLAGFYATENEGAVRPYVRAAYRSELGGGGRDNEVSAYFDGDAATSFTVVGPDAGRHELDLDEGLNAVMDDGTLFIGAQETVFSDTTELGLHGGIRIAF